jgi:hypothetical protein
VERILTTHVGTLARPDTLVPILRAKDPLANEFYRTDEEYVQALANALREEKAGADSFEAANPRHEHEYHVLEQFPPPDGTILIPGGAWPG